MPLIVSQFTKKVNTSVKPAAQAEAVKKALASAGYAVAPSGIFFLAITPTKVIRS